jgi:hypothetical protein
VTWSCFFFVSSSLNVVRYASKTSSRCRTILTLRSTEASDLCIVILGAKRRICETARYEPAQIEGWLYYEIKFNAKQDDSFTIKNVAYYEHITFTSMVGTFCYFRRTLHVLRLLWNSLSKMIIRKHMSDYGPVFVLYVLSLPKFGRQMHDNKKNDNCFMVETL